MVALNLWGNIVVNMFLGFFGRVFHCRTPKLALASNLRLLRHVFNIRHLR